MGPIIPWYGSETNFTC